MKRAQLLWLIVLGAAVCLTCSPKALAQAQTVIDDGLYTVYIYVDTDGSNVYASSAYIEDIDADETYEEFTTISSAAYWQLSGGGFSASGSGESFSSAVQSGSTYTANFNYLMEFTYFETPYEGSTADCEVHTDVCYGFDYPSASASIYVPSPPPIITSISPSSVYQGDQGTLTITGSNFIENSGDQLTLNFSGSNNPFTLMSAPSTCTSSCTATFSYDFSGYPTGNYQLYVTNNEASSEPVTFTVRPAWPVDPCAVGSSPKTQYSSLISTGAAGGSGSVTVSFSGAAYAAISQTVPYGPYSTTSSLAAHIAAIITFNATQYGLTARAFGPNIVYSGKSAVGTVTITGSSFTTTTSSAAASAAGMACMVAPPSPLAACSGMPSMTYVLAVTHDSVDWITPPNSVETGRNVNYSLLGWPNRQYPNGVPLADSDPGFQSTVSEHLEMAMSFGFTTKGKFSGQFDDILGRATLGIAAGEYKSRRCFTVAHGAPNSAVGQSLGWVQSFDFAGGKRTMHSYDDLYINKATSTTIVNNYTDAHGKPKSIDLP